MASLPLEEVLKGCPRAQEEEEKKLSKPQPEQSLKCPRCESTNTKFCYYNNYSLSQPRYFCKGCRRYWTKGGSLRNVPVGGGCRKNRRSSSTASSSSSSSKSKPQDQLQPFGNPHPPLPPASSLLPPLLAYDPNELTLALARLQKQPHNPEPHYLVGNPNLDILGADHIPCGGGGGGGFHNLYCGYKCEDVIQPFGGDGFGGATATAATTVTTTTTSQVSCKDAGVEAEDRMGMELQWPIGGDCIMGLESGGRENYWINGVGSNWQSLINSSLI